MKVRYFQTIETVDKSYRFELTRDDYIDLYTGYSYVPCDYKGVDQVYQVTDTLKVTLTMLWDVSHDSMFNSLYADALSGEWPELEWLIGRTASCVTPDEVVQLYQDQYLVKVYQQNS